MAADPCLPSTAALHAPPGTSHARHHIAHRVLGRLRHRVHNAQFHAVPPKPPLADGCGKHLDAARPDGLAASPTDPAGATPLAKAKLLGGTKAAAALAVSALGGALGVSGAIAGGGGISTGGHGDGGDGGGPGGGGGGVTAVPEPSSAALLLLALAAALVARRLCGGRP